MRKELQIQNIQNKIRQYYKNCTLCPRNCGVDRTAGKTGACGMTDTLVVARAAKHMWEEPCISGTKGSGAVFFGGCNLKCMFCQNQKISRGQAGKEIDAVRLAEIFLELQEQDVNNINLVTGTHFLPHIIEALGLAKEQGLAVPIVYNCSGYESVDALKRLEGYVDVYLPDFKYMDEDMAQSYSRAKDYPTIAQKAIAEMVRQQPLAVFAPESGKSKRLSLEAKEGYVMKKGVLVRQLLLPGGLEDAKKIVGYLHEYYGNQIYISMMSQYTVMKEVKNHPVLGKNVSKEEYEAYLTYAQDIGVTHGFFQEGGVNLESFIPEFDCYGV